MAMDQWGYWEQFPPPPHPAMPSTLKVPDVTMTMSKQVHSYVRNEGAQNRQARKRQKRVTPREWSRRPCTKGGRRVIPFRLVPLARYEHRWYSPQPFDLFQKVPPFNHCFRKLILNIRLWALSRGMPLGLSQSLIHGVCSLN